MNIPFPSSAAAGQNKLQSGAFVLTAPTVPAVPYVLSLNHNPGAVREVPVRVSPRSGTTFTRKSALPVNDQTSSELAEDLALGQAYGLFLFPFICLSLLSLEDCCQPPRL